MPDESFRDPIVAAIPSENRDLIVTIIGIVLRFPPVLYAVECTMVDTGLKLLGQVYPAGEYAIPRCIIHAVVI